MQLYLDADFFLALLKPNDRLKDFAKEFYEKNSAEHELLTSTASLLEIWFYLYRNNLRSEIPTALRAVKDLKIHMISFNSEDVGAGSVLAQSHSLSPLDSIHAMLALRTDGIVSTDESFDRVPELKRIDFSKA